MESERLDQSVLLGETEKEPDWEVFRWNGVHHVVSISRVDLHLHEGIPTNPKLPGTETLACRAAELRPDDPPGP